jgi:glucose-fructose oxidoreductase
MDASDFTSERKIKYAVIGLGEVAVNSILPSFENARQNSQLAGLVSGTPSKLDSIGNQYGVALRYSYGQFERCLRNEEIDAVYIALPNKMHCEFAVRAAEAGKHVLVEKPLALTADECERMIGAAEFNDVKLMTAYRLHFDEPSLRAIEIVHSGEIGDARVFHGMFSMPVERRELHFRKEMGAGALYDLGLYSINAARNLFRDEPVDVLGVSAKSGNGGAGQFEDLTTAILGFRNGRQAILTCGFGPVENSYFQILGDRGDLRAFPAFGIGREYKHEVTVDGHTHRTTYPRRDQFAPELLYFSKCILEDIEPEPSGREGLADVRVIEACLRSCRLGQAVPLESYSRRQWPTIRQEICCPAPTNKSDPRGPLH